MSYLLSPQDLCGLDHVEALVKSGIKCLKIEGRVKDQFYVAATTSAYRNAVDTAWNKLQQESELEEPSQYASISTVETNHDGNSAVSKQDLAQIFSRGQDERHDGLSSGFLAGS